MTTWAVIPVKAPAACKTRLAPALDAAERQALAASMLAQVTAAARGASGVDEVLILGPSRHGLAGSIRLLADPGGGLNAALSSALAAALAAQVGRLIVLAGDLPHLRSTDVEALADLSPEELGLAPDRRGLGTNALSLPLPAAADFRFQYGEESFAPHLAEAARLGLAPRTIRSGGLALDIDAPEDLAALAG
jgi:2-phospho-L-lactate/phosphoenolpyruvate guanylyltransferase